MGWILQMEEKVVMWVRIVVEQSQCQVVARTLVSFRNSFAESGLQRIIANVELKTLLRNRHIRLLEKLDKFLF